MQQQPVDYGRKWYVMAAVAMGILLATIDGSIVNVALPTLVRALNTEFAVVQWVVLAYLLMVTTLMLSIGRLGDMIGKKSLYGTGFVIFTLGSVLCGLSPTIYWLIGFRVLQAIGAAMMMALGTAIVTEAFPPSERGKALGIIGSMVSIGIVIGPVLGGILIGALSWHWIFFVNLPIGILGSLMVARFVPALKPAGEQRFDYLGALTLFVSLMALLLALTFGQRVGFAAPVVVSLFAGWLVFLVIFLIIEWKSSQPMIDLNLFQNRLFSINLITGFITFVAMAGTIILMPFYLENVLGYGPRSVGFLLAIVPVAVGIVAPVSGSLSDRLGTRPITVAGLLTLLLGFYAASTLNMQTTALGYVLRFLPIGIGMGVFQSPNNSAIMGAAPRARLGVASGLLSITRTLGQTSGIATLGALWASRIAYRGGNGLQGGATAAPATTQVAALHDTFVAIVILIALALMLGVWGLVQEWRGRSMPEWAANPSQRKRQARFYLLTLGCPKNLVDSEGMSELLVGGGYRATDDPSHADVLIVNTCGFLEAARAESIEALQELARTKRPDQALVVAGCMPQRFGADLIRNVPGLDGLIGTRSWPDIVPFLGKLRASRHHKPIFHLPETGETPVETMALKRTGQGPRASAYLKISDGCSAPCAFCTIPDIKGPARSRPKELILREARALVDQGVQEIILIAQDTTAYGRDWGERNGLPTLIEDLLRTAPDLRWLRLMYAYPGHASQRLVDVMATHPQVCHYLDLPLQHAHPDTLRRMRRPHNVEKLLHWIESFRGAMPDAALRTTFIVGYPGETEVEFQGLLDFMQAVQFDRVGVFPFSRESGTPAYDLPDQVPDQVKQERYRRAMELQQAISLAKNQSQTGRRLEVLVDGVGDGVSIARSYRDAPEIDGFVVIEKELPVGEMVPVLITGAMPYDLLAAPADQPIIVV